MDISEIKTLLGLRIKSFRTGQKYSQEEFSSIIGLEQSNLSNIENGKTFPDITTLCAIINKTNIEPNYLLGFLSQDENKYSSIDIEITNLLISLSQETKEALKKFLISLKQ